MIFHVMVFIPNELAQEYLKQKADCEQMLGCSITNQDFISGLTSAQLKMIKNAEREARGGAK